MFDPAVLKVVAINGGTFVGFEAAPVASATAFASGDLDFTANNQGFVETPATAIVATIKFQAVGHASEGSEIRLSRSKRGDFMLKRANDRFRKVAARVSRAHGIVAVR